MSFRQQAKGEKEYRVGIGGWRGQGWYILAKSKKAAYNIAIRSYMKSYGATRARAKDRIKMGNIRVWRNADGSTPAWRKK